MEKPKPNYSKYITPKEDPPCVQYWDREFSASPLWMDWTMLKTMVKTLVPDIQSDLNVGLIEANHVLWTAFVEATCGDVTSPCHDAYVDFMTGMSDYNFAYWLPRLTIGSDIHDGMSEANAMKKFGKWLKAHPSHPIFGRYKVHPNLDITKIPKRRIRKRK